MGEVWVAKQTEPVKRKVALKLIKTSMDSRAVLHRFEQERQALGMMDHPNIARVLDAGTAHQEGGAHGDDPHHPEEEPSKPSTRLSTEEALPSLAALRQTEPKKLMALLRGELDCVVLKCQEKQRERRYDTANGLARDIQRYLADEVVEARPPSAVRAAVSRPCHSVCGWLSRPEQSASVARS